MTTFPFDRSMGATPGSHGIPFFDRPSHVLQYADLLGPPIDMLALVQRLDRTRDFPEDEQSIE